MSQDPDDGTIIIIVGGGPRPPGGRAAAPQDIGEMLVDAAAQWRAEVNGEKHDRRFRIFHARKTSPLHQDDGA